MRPCCFLQLNWLQEKKQQLMAAKQAAKEHNKQVRTCSCARAGQ